MIGIFFIYAILVYVCVSGAFESFCNALHEKKFIEVQIQWDFGKNARTLCMTVLKKPRNNPWYVYFIYRGTVQVHTRLEVERESENKRPTAKSVTKSFSFRIQLIQIAFEFVLTDFFSLLQSICGPFRAVDGRRSVWIRRSCPFPFHWYGHWGFFSITLFFWSFSTLNALCCSLWATSVHALESLFHITARLCVHFLQ